ncbi:MAG: nucleotide pyrophosphohydrolase [Bacillota bacterium]|nr:nucleotide pyrophosphohydrolase [Bacillota bacterium]
MIGLERPASRGAPLRTLQEETDAWIREQGASYWEPLALLARLSEEVGELARELNARYGPKRKREEEPPGSVAEELGDILYVVACMANRLEIDLDRAWLETLEKYRRRDRRRWSPPPLRPEAGEEERPAAPGG